MRFQKLKSLAMIGLISVTLAACGGKSDATIKSEVDGRIKNPTVTSAVSGGVVTLTGSAATQAERDAAIAAARGEGVKEVKDSIQIKPR